MKRTHSALVFGALAMLGSIATTSVARAADFPQTQAAQQFSIARGFAQTSMPTQQRVAPSASAAAVSSTLLAALCAGACRGQAVTQRPNGLHSTGNGWLLDVSADGSSARFENLALEGQAPSLAKDPSHALTAATLEAAGRALIASKLGSSIVLGPQEELVPLRTDYLIAGNQNLKTRAVRRYVLANRIVFGRRLRGVPVVGGGSTVVFTFANNGALESLRYDWPHYRPATSQAVVNVSEIVHRVNSVIGARKTAARAPTSALQISGKIQANAPAGKPGTVLQKLECGYFDPGVAARAANAAVQPGCVYHVVRRDSDGMRQGFAGAVPAGASFAPDPGWAESLLLRSR